MSITTREDAIRRMRNNTRLSELRAAIEACAEIIDSYKKERVSLAGMCYLAGIVEGKRIERARRKEAQERAAATASSAQGQGIPVEIEASPALEDFIKGLICAGLEDAARDDQRGQGAETQPCT